jgi:hypothetical protein
MNKRKGINNILSIYNLATEEDIEEGKVWYREARLFSRRMAKEYGVSLDVAIACLSALSPRNKWSNNLKNVEAVLLACQEGRGPETVKVGTFNRNKEKAFRIVLENAPILAKTSNKTAAFFDNIRNPESTDVTVDIHAFSIFFGFRAEPSTLTDKQYNIIASAYQLASKRVGVKPYEVQAICWIVWRRLTAKERVRKVLSSQYGNVERYSLAA